MICISCKHTHQENYCPCCGEQSKTPKITLASIAAGAFSTVTNMDKGFLFNIKSLFLEPQKFTQAYISGKRKGIINPISFLIISTTLYIIVVTLLKIPKVLNSTPELAEETTSSIGIATGRFIATYLKYFWILSILPLGLALKLLFSKKYSYIENVAVSSFVIGQATLIAIVSFLFLRTPIIADPIVFLAIVYFIYRIYRDDSKKIKSFLLAFLAAFLFLFLMMLIILTVSYLLGDLADF